MQQLDGSPLAEEKRGHESTQNPVVAGGFLRGSLRPEGRLSRYYELQTNTPLYMTHDYQLTNDDSKPQEHYG